MSSIATFAAGETEAYCGCFSSKLSRSSILPPPSSCLLRCIAAMDWSESSSTAPLGLDNWVPAVLIRLLTALAFSSASLTRVASPEVTALDSPAVWASKQDLTLADLLPGLTCRISYGVVRHHFLVVGLFLNRPTCLLEVFDDAVEVPAHLESRYDPVEVQVWVCSRPTATPPFCPDV